MPGAAVTNSLEAAGVAVGRRLDRAYRVSVRLGEVGSERPCVVRRSHAGGQGGLLTSTMPCATATLHHSNPARRVPLHPYLNDVLLCEDGAGGAGTKRGQRQLGPCSSGRSALDSAMQAPLPCTPAGTAVEKRCNLSRPHRVRHDRRDCCFHEGHPLAFLALEVVHGLASAQSQEDSGCRARVCRARVCRARAKLHRRPQPTSLPLMRAGRTMTCSVGSVW